MADAIVKAVSDSELLVIERLADALVKAASVDEIKDVRDRAIAIQGYARKKASGLIAAQAAGRVVTDATKMLAKLYAEEETARGANLPNVTAGRDRDHDRVPIGKEAVAGAAGMNHATLSRLGPLVDPRRDDYVPPEVQASVAARIEAEGKIVTPAALLRRAVPGGGKQMGSEGKPRKAKKNVREKATTPAPNTTENARWHFRKETTHMARHVRDWFVASRKRGRSSVELFDIFNQIIAGLKQH